MAIQKMQNQHKIGFLDSFPDTPKEPKENLEGSLSLNAVAAAQKAKVLNPKDSVLKSGRSVMSARAGDVTDMGGPKKFMGSETGNSVWNTNKIGDQAQESPQKTTELDDPRTLRQLAEKERLDKLVTALGETDQRKSSTVSPSGTYQGDNYKTTRNTMSIFDSSDFERLPEKTAGEIASDDVQKRRDQVDDSWKHSGKSLTSSDVVNRMFEGLTSSKTAAK